MQTMTTQDVIDSISSFQGRGLFLFAAKTKQEALKKARDTKEPTPDHLRFITVAKVMTVSIGNDYTQAVNNRLEKEGKDGDFQAQSSYAECISENRMLYRHKKTGQHYLRVYPNLCKSFHTVIKRYDANGKQIADEDWKAIQAKYFKLPTENMSQGLDNAIIVNNYSIENVKFLKHGDVIVNQMDEEFVKLLVEKIAA